MPGWTILLFLFLISTPLRNSAYNEFIIRVLLLHDVKASFRADAFKSLYIKGVPNQLRKIKSIKIIHSNGQTKYSTDNTNGKLFLLPKDFNLIIKNNDNRGVWLGKRRYAGELRVSMKNNKLQVINHLEIDKYLRSVVGSEMPKEFPLAALQAQAVASRTYAMQLLNKKRDFDVKATQDSQVYLGLESETPITRKAVRSTKTLVLTYQDKLINSVFHSSSGGRTEASGNVWKYQFPYLISVVDYDQNSPKYRWSKEISSAKLDDIFNELGGLNSIQVISKSESNRVLKVLIYGPKGKKLISGKTLRKNLDLKSTKFDLDLGIGDAHNKKEINYYINNSYISLNEDLGKGFISPKLPPIRNEYVLSVRGLGAGHGVGMSQWGAKAMADKGASFRKILRHYYRGVKINSYY